MAGSWLGAIGRATPAITKTMEDIEERPIRAMRVGWEQEKMGMERESFGQRKALHGVQMEREGQTKAVNEITLNKMKYEEKQRQEKEAYLNKPWNAEMDLMLADLPEEYKGKALNMMKQTGMINDKNVGTMKSREMVTEMFKSKPEIFEWYAKGRETKLKGIAEKAMEDYQKINDDPSVDPEKLAKARDKAVAAGEQLSVFMGAKSDILGKMKTAKEYEGLLNDIKKSDTWRTLSDEEKGSLEIGAIEAVKTGSTEGWKEAVKNVVKKEKETENLGAAKIQEFNAWKLKKGNENKSYEDFMRFEASLSGKAGDFKDSKIKEMWSGLTDDEKKRIIGARVDPKELTEKNILDLYGNIMTDPTVRKSIQPIAEKIIQGATQKPSPTGVTPSSKVVNELPKGAKLQGYSADGKKIYEVPPTKPGGKSTYIKEQ